MYPVPPAYKGFHEDEDDDLGKVVVAEDDIRPTYPVPDAYLGYSNEPVKKDDLAGLKL